MPFKSRAQQKFLFSKKKKLAKEFASKTSKEDYEDIPDKVGFTASALRSKFKK